MIDQAVAELAPLVGVRAGCAAVGEAQARWYRRHRQSPPPPRPERVPVPQPRALSEVERKELRRVLNSEEFVDEAPATVYAKVLDQGVYLASVPTMYRVLRAHDGPRAPPPGDPPGGQEARAAGDQAQPGLLVGHHQAARPGQVDLRLPVFGFQRGVCWGVAPGWGGRR